MLTVPDTDRFYDKLHTKIVSSCARCRGNGRRAVEGPDGDLRIEQCECLQQISAATAKLHANIPREFWEASTIETDARPFIDQYIGSLREHRRHGVGLLFYGDLGRGKTTSAVTVLLAAARAGHTIGYLTTADYVLSAIPASDDAELGAYRRELSQATFLLLDEFGNEYKKKGSDYARLELEQLLRWRRSQCLPTILCVNFANAAELKAVVGETVWSLLGGRTKSFAFSGGDHRRA